MEIVFPEVLEKIFRTVSLEDLGAQFDKPAVCLLGLLRALECPVIIIVAAERTPD